MLNSVSIPKFRIPEFRVPKRQVESACDICGEFPCYLSKAFFDVLKLSDIQ